MKRFSTIFLQVYLIYTLLLLLFPGGAESSTEQVILAYLFTIYFFTTYYFLFRFFRLDNVNYLEKLNGTYSSRKLIFTTILALVALGAYAYDRTNILGVDYSDGLASARYKLISITENNEGSYSSVFSVFGNMFIPISFWNIFYIRVFHQKKQHILFFLNLAVIVVSSILFGGRTNVLIFILIFILTTQARKTAIVSKKNLYRGVLVALMFFFIGYVFYDRAVANELDAAFYLNTMAVWQRGYVNPDLIKLLSSDNLAVISLAIILMIVLYFIHSLWVFASIIGTSAVGTALFSNYHVIFYKLGLLTTLPQEPSYAGVFISLPGAIFYQYGLFALLVSPLIIILIKFIFVKLSAIEGAAGRIFLFIYFTLCLTMLASPFIIITDVYMFPGLLFCAGIIAVLFTKPSTHDYRSS